MSHKCENLPRGRHDTLDRSLDKSEMTLDHLDTRNSSSVNITGVIAYYKRITRSADRPLRARNVHNVLLSWTSC